MDTDYYQEVGGASTPLFGNPEDVPLFGTGNRSSCSRCCNIFIGFITIFVVIFTVVSAFIYNKNSARGLNITLGVVIALICISHLIQIIWYRDVDSMFKMLIYFNALNIVLLCVCANVYFHGG